MIPERPASRIRALADRLGQLAPDWRDPESYFANRDEIERELLRLAREMELAR